MQHRHLHPNEIDLLLDGEVGFGVAPLRAHVEGCAECRAKLDDVRLVTDALDRLPHFAPTVRFADSVMAQVHIVEPWHVALVESAQRLVPQSRAVRMVMAGSALTVASVLSASAVWLAFRADVARYLVNLAADRGRQSVVHGASAVLDAAFGQSAIDAMRGAGMSGVMIGAALLVTAAGGATLGLRAMATASRRARN